MSNSDSFKQQVESMQVLQSLPDAVLVVDSEGRVVLWNSAAEQISGYSTAKLLGRECPDGLLQNVARCAPDACHPGCAAQVCLNDGQRRELLTYIRHRDGHIVPVLAKLAPVMQGGDVVATVAQLSDITPRAVQEPQITGAREPGAWIDAATLLPSMLASTAQLRESFERWKLTGERFSVILISAADILVVQRHHGTKTMERLIAAFGKTLSGAVRQNDFVGRWMDDQFIALLPHCAQPQAREAGRRLLSLLQQTAVCHDGEYVSARVHIALSSVRASDTPTKLLERLYREIKRKEEIADPESAHTPTPFHQQRPM